jgi:3-hydroxyacyl-CoA dehydrogenase
VNNVVSISIGIIGAGTMVPIALRALQVKTLIFDINNEIVNNSISRIINGYEKFLERGKIDKSVKESAAGNLLGIPKLDAWGL